MKLLGAVVAKFFEEVITDGIVALVKAPFRGKRDLARSRAGSSRPAAAEVPYAAERVDSPSR